MFAYDPKRTFSCSCSAWLQSNTGQIFALLTGNELRAFTRHVSLEGIRPRIGGGPMRNKLISSLAGAAFSFAVSGLAFAQAPPPAPAPNWTGWYAGINFGGGFGTSNNATTTTTTRIDDLAQFFPGATPSGSTAGANTRVAALNQSGPIGGVQFGYNWQFAPLWVLGFEADIQGAAITSDRDANTTGTFTQSFAGTSTFTKNASSAPR